MYTMTPHAALLVQQEQIKSKLFICPTLREKMAAVTNIAGIDMDAQMSIDEINRRIPRGWDIEALLGSNFVVVNGTPFKRHTNA